MPTIDIPDHVLDAIEKHAFTTVRHEVGGVLFGRLADERATVVGALPALSATVDQTSVTFTHQVWDEIHAQMEAHHPDERIVGWYHTHPGFGLFLSEYDKFIHKNFFSDPRMVALVVDPVAGQAGWFEWRADDVLDKSTFATRTPPAAAPTTVTKVDVERARRSRVVPGLVLGGLAIGIGGYLLGVEGAGSDVPSARPAEAPIKDPDIAADEARLLRAEAARLRESNARLRTRVERVRGRPEIRSIRYVVRSGDTLSALARVLYGDPADYRRIVRANSGLTSPDMLRVGQTLQLPLPVQSQG